MEKAAEVGYQAARLRTRNEEQILLWPIRSLNKGLLFKIGDVRDPWEARLSADRGLLRSSSVEGRRQNGGGGSKSRQELLWPQKKPQRSFATKKEKARIDKGMFFSEVPSMNYVSLSHYVTLNILTPRF